MENKEFKIESLQDIADCTNADNIDTFLQDLKMCVMSYHLVNAICVAEEMEKPKFESFVWIDDGKNNITLNLVPDDTMKGKPLTFK